MKIVISSMTLFIISLLIVYCAHSTDSDKPDPPVIEGTVVSSNDSSAVENANILLFDAKSNEPIDRMFSAADGTFRFVVEDAGTYYLRVEAQGYRSIPLKGGTPIPFQADVDTTVFESFLLDTLGSDLPLYSFTGYIKDSDGKGISGALIAAISSIETLTGVSGSDGYFIFFNVSENDYKLEAHRAAYLQNDTAISIDPANNEFSTTGITIIMNKGEYGTVNGHVSFIAAENPDSAIDVTLIQPESKEAIPGLVTFIEKSSGSYKIEDVPYGTYIVWASFRNDGYVMDPDALYKFGYPLVTLSTTHRDTIVDIKVTGAVQLVSPTNTPDSVFPIIILSTTPDFTWTKTSSYASAKEYILEVTDVNGRVIWGGFDENGVVAHQQLTSGTYAKTFNFDGSATVPLVSGNIYRWKVYADDDDAENVQTLLSASEYQLGIFSPLSDTASGK